MTRRHACYTAKEAAMNRTAILLVALGAVFAALYNTFTKKVQTGDWKNRTSLLVALHLGGAALLLFVTALFTGGAEIKPGFLWPMLATGMLNIGIMFGKMKARALEDVSLVTPIDSTTPAVVIVTSMIILGEYPSRLGWIGIWLLAIGTYVLNIQDFKEALAQRVDARAVTGWRRAIRIWLAPFLALGRSAGVRWAFFAVGLSTVALPYDGLVARRANMGFGFGCVCAIAALGNLVVALRRDEHRGVKPGEAVSKATTLALLLAAAIWITGFAFRLDIVPYVGTMKRLAIPLTIIFAYYLAGEKKSFRERLLGGVIMVVGAALITLGGK